MNNLNGMLLIDKPSGITSFNVVHRLRKITNIKKIGHCGTLDPFATGLLILCLGKGTKKVSLFTNKDKVYLSEFTFGEQRNTDDITGEIINQFDTEIDFKSLYYNIKSMIGNIEQMPPSFSAKKLGGKRAYSLARQNIAFKLTPSLVTIYSIHILSFIQNKLITTIHCSKGTYIRSIARDLGILMNNGGYVSSLRRLSIGEYDLNHNNTIHNLDSLTLSEIQEKIISLD